MKHGEMDRVAAFWTPGCADGEQKMQKNPPVFEISHSMSSTFFYWNPLLSFVLLLIFRLPDEAPLSLSRVEKALHCYSALFYSIWSFWGSNPVGLCIFGSAEIMPKPSFPRLPELTEEQMPLTWPWGDRMMDQRGSDDSRLLVVKEYSPDPPQERSIKEAQLVGGMAGRNMSTLVRSMEYSSIESCRILGCLWLLTINQTFKNPSKSCKPQFFLSTVKHPTLLGSPLLSIWTISNFGHLHFGYCCLHPDFAHIAAILVFAPSLSDHLILIWVCLKIVYP